MSPSTFNRARWRAPFRPRRVRLRDGREILVRAIEAGDRSELVQGFDRLSRRSRYLRFMQHVSELDDELLDRATHPLAGREFTLVAVTDAPDGFDIVGAARYVQAVALPDRCEFSITVADAWQRCGLAIILLNCLIRRARSDGYRILQGDVMAGNAAMLALARRLNFVCRARADDATIIAVERIL